MLTNITPIESLANEANKYQSFLERKCSEEVTDVIERGRLLSVVISRSGKMLADAEYHRDALMKSEIMDVLRDAAKQALPSLVMKQLVEAACKDTNHLVKHIERINRSATHELDWCRTLISNAKSERDAIRGFTSTTEKKRGNVSPNSSNNTYQPYRNEENVPQNSEFIDDLPEDNSIF